MLIITKKNGVPLALFSAFLTGIIALANKLTKPIIDGKILQQQKKLFDQVIPTDFYDNELQKACFLVRTPQLGKGDHHVYIASRNGISVGAVMEVTAPDGYSGAIKLLVGSDFFGTILGVRVIEHHETPSLGDKIELSLSNWILCFTGTMIHESNDPTFSIKKDGGKFDQFTGATITPRAVVNAVKRAGLYAQTLPSQLSTLTTCKY